MTTQEGRKKRLKKAVTIGAAIMLSSSCIGLGNYFTLKKNIEKTVSEKIETLRIDIQRTLNETHYSSKTAMLQGVDGNAVDNKTETDATETGKGSSMDPYFEAIMSLVSQLNRTLSTEIQQLSNASELLNIKMDTTQKKTELLEEKVNHDGIGNAGPTGASEVKGQANNQQKAHTNTAGDPPKQNKIPREKPPIEKHVYFSVALTKTLNNLGQNHLLLFDLVYSNEGGGYESKTGKFKAPTAGTYLFMFFVEVVNEEGKRAHVNLVVDGQYRASAVAEAWHDGQEMTSANAAVTHLTKGQKVWIQTAQTNDTPYDIDRKRTTFTGVLMFS